jgi:hypothetical protein
MSDQINDSNIEFLHSLTATSFLIKLSRKDVLNQIASFYVCCKTNSWHFTLDDPIQSYNVEIEEGLIDYAINCILKNNSDLDKLTYPFNLKVFYEDLNIVGTKYVSYPKPTNYLEIVDAIKNKIQ